MYTAVREAPELSIVSGGQFGQFRFGFSGLRMGFQGRCTRQPVVKVGVSFGGTPP
jgi:hypothetical protein